jgi:hypothetical protein
VENVKYNWKSLWFPPINLWNVPGLNKYYHPPRGGKTSCQKKCKLDEALVCTGCNRTIEEIKQAYEDQIYCLDKAS